MARYMVTGRCIDGPIYFSGSVGKLPRASVIMWDQDRRYAKPLRLGEACDARDALRARNSNVSVDEGIYRIKIVRLPKRRRG